MSSSNPFLLAADNNPSLIALLQESPAVALKQDEHGYSLLHAAISWSHLDLAGKLVRDFGVDVNILDEDEESPLFSVETLKAAKYLVEELNADITLKNHDGLVAAEKIADDGEYPVIAAYLIELSQQKNSTTSVDATSHSLKDADQRSEAVRPPPLPEGVSVEVGSALEASADETVVDPALKARIEELAQRDDFHGEEGQRQLRELVTDTLRGHIVESSDAREVRRRE